MIFCSSATISIGNANGIWKAAVAALELVEGLKAVLGVKSSSSCSRVIDLITCRGP